MKIVRKQLVRKYLAAAKHLKSRHISVRLYVMLQNVVRYLVQNIVVHCVNMVRHVLCCDYLGGWEGAGYEGAGEYLVAWWKMPFRHSTHCSVELLLSWLDSA